jgi:hypothetical protein
MIELVLSAIASLLKRIPLKTFLSSCAALVMTLGVVACGSSSGASSTGTAAARPQGGGGFASRLTSAQQSCIKKQGVTLPTGRPGGGRPGGGPPPGSTNGQPPTGTNGAPPNGGQGGFRNSPQAQKMRAAFKACGIQMPTRPGAAAPAASNG